MKRVLRKFLDSQAGEIHGFRVEVTRPEGEKTGSVRLYRVRDNKLAGLTWLDGFFVRKSVFGPVGSAYSASWRIITPRDLPPEETPLEKEARAVRLVLKADPEVRDLYGYCDPIVDVQETLAAMRIRPNEEEELQAAVEIFQYRLRILKARVGLN